MVEDYSKENPFLPPQQQIDKRYGWQRRNEPKIKRGTININGEQLTARQALEKYPKLKNYLQNGKELKPSTLYSKSRKLSKEGKLPEIDMATEINFTRLRQTKNGVVSHHEITIDINTSPTDFLERSKKTLIIFLKENPNHKFE